MIVSIAFTIYAILTFIIAFMDKQPSLSSNTMIWMVGIGVTFITFELSIISFQLDKLIKATKNDNKRSD